MDALGRAWRLVVEYPQCILFFFCFLMQFGLWSYASHRAAKRRFSQKLSNLELWSLLTTYRNSYMGFSKNPLLDP